MAVVIKTKPLTKRTIGKVAKDIQKLIEKGVDKKIVLKEVKAMILYLSDNYASVSYSLSNHTLTVQTDDIITRGHNFGPYDIIFNVKRAYKPNNDEGYYYGFMVSGASHEHVYSSGHMCSGDGYHVLRKSLRDGRIDDFIDVVQQILRTG